MKQVVCCSEDQRQLQNMEAVGGEGLPRQWDRDSSLEAVLAGWRRTWLLFQGH